MWVAFCKKVPNVLSRCHAKRRKCARGRARPSFGMTPTFPKKKRKRKKEKNFGKKIFPKQILKSRCHTKRRTGARGRARPSFGMTTTQDIRDLFAYRSPHGNGNGMAKDFEYVNLDELDDCEDSGASFSNPCYHDNSVSMVTDCDPVPMVTSPDPVSMVSSVSAEPQDLGGFQCNQFSSRPMGNSKRLGNAGQGDLHSKQSVEHGQLSQPNVLTIYKLPNGITFLYPPLENHLNFERGCKTVGRVAHQKVGKKENSNIKKLSISCPNTPLMGARLSEDHLTHITYVRNHHRVKMNSMIGRNGNTNNNSRSESNIYGNVIVPRSPLIG